MLDNTTATSSALNTEQLLTVDTPTLCKLLCCGRYTAIQIGDLRARAYRHKQPCSLECTAHQGVCLQNRLLIEPPQQTREGDLLWQVAKKTQRVGS